MKVVDRIVRRIALEAITVSHNPRCPAKKIVDALPDAGYVHPNDKPWTLIELIRTLALSDKQVDREEFVSFIERHDEKEHGIVDLARSRRHEEIQAIMLRSFRVKDNEQTAATGQPVYFERYGLVCGERRLLAQAYNFAKFGDDQFATIGADVRKLTLIEAEILAEDENLQRKDMTPLEVGHIIARQMERQNPVTGRNFTLKEVAKTKRLDYQYARNRHALTKLPPELQDRLDQNHDRPIGLTEAAKIGLRLKQGKPAHEPKGKKTTRNKMLTLKQCQVLFDDTPRSKGGYIQALADCMQISLERALRESDKRRESVELDAARKAEKKIQAA